MKNLSFYHIPIAYMILFTLLILGTGLWLFFLSQGLAGSEGLAATLVKVIQSPEPKSLHNFIEVATPHMFAMGTLLFVVAHFMLFSTKISQSTALIVSILLFLFMLFNIFSYGVISLGFIVSGWIKLLFMSLFVGMFLVLLFMVGVSL